MITGGVIRDFAQDPLIKTSASSRRTIHIDTFVRQAMSRDVIHDRVKAQMEQFTEPQPVLFHASVEAISHGLLIADDSVLLYANPAACTMLGYASQAPLQGAPRARVMDAAEWERARVHQRTPSGIAMRTHLRHRDGSAVPVSLELATVQTAGPQHVVVVIRPEAPGAQTISHAQMDRLLLTRLEAQQAEIARELHDALGSDLTGISMMLAQMKPRIDAQSPLAPHIDLIQMRLASTMKTTRRLARGLMPVYNIPGALVRAMEQLTADWSELRGVPCFLQVHGHLDAVQPVAGIHVYRIAQEAIVNAVRHGGASRINVVLQEDAEAAQYRLVVDDDGRGLAAGATAARRPEGLGMQSAHARARLIGGQIDYESNDRHGCRVVVTWPHR